MITVALNIAQVTGQSLDEVYWNMSGALFYALAAELGYKVEQKPDEIIRHMQEAGIADQLQAQRRANPPPTREEAKAQWQQHTH